MLRAGCCSSHQVDVLEGLLSLLFTGPSLATLAEDKMSIKSVRDAKRYGQFIKRTGKKNPKK